MFGLSFTHLLVLAVIAIVFIGPEQLPEVARTLARLLNEWKRASSEIQTSLTSTFTETPKPPQTPVVEPPPHLAGQYEGAAPSFQDDKDQPLEKDPEKKS